MAEEKDEKTKPSSSRRRLEDELEANGGLVLIGSGIALIVLACVFASEVTVAPAFVLSGTMLLILGAFYPRIEGTLEASPEGLRTTVRALRRRVQEEELPPEIAEEALYRVLEEPKHKGRSFWSDRPIEIQVGHAINQVQSEHESILAALEHWLSENGYRTRREIGRADLVGEGEPGPVLAEVKISKSIGMDAIRRLAALGPTDETARPMRRILALPASSRITETAFAEARRLDIELLTVDHDDQVTELDAHEVRRRMDDYLDGDDE